jgi:hypothetical protein
LCQLLGRRERPAFLEGKATCLWSRELLREADDSIARKEREYALADVIVADSDYVRQTFERRP